MSIVNQGTISADVSGESITIQAINGALTNQGNLSASNDGTLTINAPTWSNPGTIVAINATEWIAVAVNGTWTVT